MIRRPLLLLAFCFLAPYCTSPAAAFERRDNGRGIPLHWPDSPLPIPYFIESGGCPDVPDGSDLEAIQSAFQTWENVATGRIEFQFRGLVERDALSPDASVIMWLKEEWPFDPSYVAKTRLFYAKSDGRILKVEILLNARDYRWSTNGESGTLDVQNVATHEIGHFIGLADLPTEGATMFEFITPGEMEKSYLSNDEIEGVRAAYPSVAEDEELLIRVYTPDEGIDSLRPLDGGIPVSGQPGLAAICPLGRAGTPDERLGLLIARDGALTLNFLGMDGASEGARDIPLGGIAAGRIRAAASLDLDRDGFRNEIALLVSAPGGPRAFLYPASPGEIPRSFSLSPPDTDDIVAFAPFHSIERGIGDSLVTVEKRRNSDFVLTIARASLPGSEGRELDLETLRSWTVPQCAGIRGIAILEASPGQRDITLLARSSSGALELLLYGPPFVRYPPDGAPLEPDRRLDASPIEKNGRPIGISAADGGAHLAVLLAR